MQNIRIIELPQMKVVCSGPLNTGDKFASFNKWFSEYHKKLKYQLCPRDFMWYNERLGVKEWFYALPENADIHDCGNFEIKDFKGGLYAVASCLDADIDKAEDWMKTYNQLTVFANNSDKFSLDISKDEGRERYPMFHIVSPVRLFDKGLSIEDMYMPITEK